MLFTEIDNNLYVVSTDIDTIAGVVSTDMDNISCGYRVFFLISRARFNLIQLYRNSGFLIIDCKM